MIIGCKQICASEKDQIMKTIPNQNVYLAYIHDIISLFSSYV